MGRDWLNTFETWGNPPGQAEEQARDRTEAEIRAALESWPALRGKNLSIYSKGSHRRGTNVRKGSDVDIAVELTGTASAGRFFVAKKVHRAESLSDADLGLFDVDPGYGVAQLKQDIHDALVHSFGSAPINWSNKCIKVREKATTLPADVVPCQTHRQFYSRDSHHDGIRIRPDNGPIIINWPQQDIDNGTAKNKRTHLRYKRAVRGIKALENEMVDKGILKPVPSFMMECAVFNVADGDFSDSSNYVNCVRVLRGFAEAINDPASVDEWVEVNKLKYLFRTSQSWTLDDLARLVIAAVDYLD